MCEGFGYSAEIDSLDKASVIPGIERNKHQTVMFKPLCCLFNQAKYLPLRYMPIELELDSADWDAPIITDFTPPYVAPPLSDGEVATPPPPERFTRLNTSTSWCIQTCNVKCDFLSLDNSLDNS